MSKLLERSDRLRFVILESPYDSWNHPLAETIYGRMVTLKLQGYGREFPYGVMAVDSTDMISDHLLVCEETDDGLRPLVGNKSIILNKCERFHMPFAGLSIPEEAKAHEHILVMNEIIRNAKETGRDIRYAASWTMAPRERGQGEWTDLLRELFTAIYTSYYLEIPKVGITAGATIRFKVDAYVKWLGHVALHRDGRELPPIKVPHLNDEPVLWTHLESFNLEPRRVAKKWQKLWNNHVRISAPVAQAQKKAA